MAPLHVAVARLLGYRWPAEWDNETRLSKQARALLERCDELAGFADADGIVCIPSVRGEVPAVERLLSLLAATGIESGTARELASLKGHTPLTFASGHMVARAELNNVRWVSHCRDLVQLPVAA